MDNNQEALYRFAVVADTLAVAEEILQSVAVVFGDHIAGSPHVFNDALTADSADVFLCLASRVDELASQVAAAQIIGIQMTPTPQCCITQSTTDRVLSPESIATINRWILDRNFTLGQALANSEGRLNKMITCLLGFDADPLANINRLTALCGDFLRADCVLYNRLDGGRLCAWGQWQAPVGFESVDVPDGHICYDVIRNSEKGPTILRHLDTSPYAESDPNVGKFGLRTYIGHPVSLAGKHIGSLCAVFASDVIPDKQSLQMLSSIAKAIGVEEIRFGAQRAVTESEAQFHSLFTNMAEGVALNEVELDGAGHVVNYRIIEVNEKYEQIIGMRRDVVVGQLATIAFSTPEPPHLEAFSRTAIQRVPQYFETYFAPTGKHLAISVAPWRDMGFAAIISDITARKQAEEQMLYLSYHDVLTGIYNRTYFEAEIRRLECYNNKVALVIADVDGLKAANDTFGHDAGDRLLVRAAEFICAHFRRTDTVARIGGDEFAVIMYDVSAEEVADICARARQNLDQLLVDSDDISLQMSLGYAHTDEVQTSSLELFRTADNRMYRDKLYQRNSRHTACGA